MTYNKPIQKNRCGAINKNISTLQRSRRKAVIICSTMTLPLAYNTPSDSLSISGLKDGNKFQS